MMFKQGITPGVSAQADHLWKELQAAISQAADQVASKVLDEARIEEIVKGARDGATYIAVNRLVAEVGDSALQEIFPLLKQATEAFNACLLEAAKEVIVDVVSEEVKRAITS